MNTCGLYYLLHELLNFVLRQGLLGLGSWGDDGGLQLGGDGIYNRVYIVCAMMYQLQRGAPQRLRELQEQHGQRELAGPETGSVMQAQDRRNPCDIISAACIADCGRIGALFTTVRKKAGPKQRCWRSCAAEKVRNHTSLISEAEIFCRRSVTA